MKKTKRVKKKAKRASRKKRSRETFTLQAVAGEPENSDLSAEDLHRWYRALKTPVTIRMDAEVLAWFKRGGRGYQTRINMALRKLMRQQKNAAGE
jgi:uncharacterized protein (DUF4415 family)